MMDDGAPARKKVEELAELGVTGGLSDLPALLNVAKTSAVRSVRVVATSSALAIAGRARTRPAGIPVEIQRALSGAAFEGDPGKTPGMLMLAAFDPRKTVLARLGRGLRDPRAEVRRAAVMAFSVALLSAYSDRTVFLSTLQQALEHRAVPRETKAALARLVCDAGLIDLGPLALGALHDPSELTQARSRLNALQDVSTLAGVWWTHGGDITDPLELKPSGRLGVVTSGRLVTTDGSQPVDVGDGHLSSRMWVGGDGEDAYMALIHAGSPWWRMEGTNLQEVLLLEWGQIQSLPRQARMALRRVVESSMEIRAANRLRPQLAWFEGDHSEAIQLLDEGIAQKRPPNELYFWRGLIKQQAGDLESAKGDLEHFLSKVRKSAAHRTEAEALLRGETMDDS